MTFWDLTGFGTNLDGSTGLVSMLVVAGEQKYATGTGRTILFPNEDGYINAAFGISEDGAIVEYRFHKISDANYIRTLHFHAGQTERSTLNKSTMRLAYPIAKGDSITVDLTNAAAKMDAVLFLISRGGKTQISEEPIFGDIPDNAYWVKGTTAHTQVADQWTSGVVTLLNYNLKRDKQYKVYAAVGHGATLMAARFAPLTGPWSEYRPGIRGGDTDQINTPTYFKDPWIFEGLTSFNIETLAFAADTSGLFSFLIAEM